MTTTPCQFPGCREWACSRNRADQPMCVEHVPVVVHPSFVHDRHEVSSGGEG